jgi:hypothetical protein
VQAPSFAGKGVQRERLAKRVDQRLGQAHVGSHERVELRE